MIFCGDSMAKGDGDARKFDGLPLLDQWDGSPESKACLHRDGQRVLRAVATELGLKKTDFEVYSNEMGEVIGGDVYLFTGTFHVTITGGYGFHDWSRDGSEAAAPRIDSYVSARKVKSMKDYAGSGDSVDLDWELLWDVKKLVEVLRLEGIVS